MQRLVRLRLVNGGIALRGIGKNKQAAAQNQREADKNFKIHTHSTTRF